jgi:putative drug exporter of the RND superfamily
VFLTEIGFLVAFGVLLDTLIVRSVLAPALTFDLDRRMWWPSRLSSASSLRSPSPRPPPRAARRGAVAGHA